MASTDQRDSLQNAICLSHHVNARSKARRPSPLKDIIHFMSQEGMISFAGGKRKYSYLNGPSMLRPSHAGLPHPSLFPIHRANFVVSNVSSPRALEYNDESVLELSSTAGSPTLANFLQYGEQNQACSTTFRTDRIPGNGAGNPQLRQWCLDFTLQIHQPPYKDVEVLLHQGNTNAWSKVVGLLCEEGDHILCESFTYPSAQALWIPLGNFAAPIPMDDQGIHPDALEQMLASWNETHPGVRRPHVLYLVGVGSNPSGTTMREDRKRTIYSICSKYGRLKFVYPRIGDAHSHRVQISSLLRMTHTILYNTLSMGPTAARHTNCNQMMPLRHFSRHHSCATTIRAE